MMRLECFKNKNNDFLIFHTHSKYDWKSVHAQKYRESKSEKCS